MLPKDNVRKLFKKQQAERNKATKIKHPFAKYDEVGRLLCIVCQSAVKSENVWQAHLGSALHQDNIQKLKALKQKQQQQQQQQQQLKRRAPSQSTSTDEQSGEEEEEKDTTERKRMRLEANETSEREGIELDEEVSDDDDAEGNQNQLPADFFDNEEPEENAVSDPMDEEEEPTAILEEDSNTVPAGFFDDPEEDARVRGALLPDEQAKVDLEKGLQEFNLAMVDVTQESRQAQEEDDEAFWQERHHDLTMEQVAFDTRVQKLKELRKSGKLLNSEKMINNNSNEEQVDGDDDMHFKLKSNVRQVLTSQPTKKVESMFDDDLDETSDEEEEEDWRAQQL